MRGSMSNKAASPTPSENEIDIIGSLLQEDEAPDLGQDDLDLDKILNAGADANKGDAADDEDSIGAMQRISYRKASNLHGKSVKKGGGFQAIGLSAHILRAIAKKGFSVPTPIQRQAIPLILDGRDVVGMARTGSGKTAAFVIPMLERLKTHSARIGARSLILSPSRELALQTLKVVKEFSRGTDLRCVLLVGGDSLEEQFGSMTANPDIVIATPGRFLHLKVEMSLDLHSMEYVVFDEADRLFEMGFAAQLTEILHSLPTRRQTLLFSATLPSSLIEFAKAGLQEPSLVRLDADTKISPDLESAFFTTHTADKEGALLHILHNVIKIPPGLPDGIEPEVDNKPSRKRKRGSDRTNMKESPTQYSTIIFTATRHHVDYIAALLRQAGFSLSYIYGALDQTARKLNVENFRRGKTHILVVTDVAARGVDLPQLANVINYDFPPQPKVFVHRVGRTARAGKRGWAYSLVKDSDAPYLIDLQLFFGRKLVVGSEGLRASFSQDVVIGALERAELDPNVEWVTKALRENDDLNALRRVAVKAERLYLKTRNSASAQSAKRARELVGSKAWTELHPLFGAEAAEVEKARSNLLARISGFKPPGTIFELGRGKTDNSEATEVVRAMRAKIRPRKTQMSEDEDKIDANDGGQDEDSCAHTEDSSGGPDWEQDEPNASEAAAFDEDEDDGDDDDDGNDNDDHDEDDNDDQFEVTISKPTSSSRSEKKPSSFRDPEMFMSYIPTTLNTHEEKAYGVTSGSFAADVRSAAMELANDEGAKAFGVPTRAKMRWDKKQNKYISRENDTDGSRGARMVVGESGVKMAASFKSGRFDKWRRVQRLGKMPQVGEPEKPGLVRNFGGVGGPRFKHKKEAAPKEADRYRDDYQVRKKRVAEAREKRVGRFRDGVGNKRELKNAVDIRKARSQKEQRKDKNARLSKKKRSK